MKIVIEEDGLYNALNSIEDYLKKALNTKDKNLKDTYISKSYGAVIAINQMVVTEDDKNDKTNEDIDPIAILKEK